MIDLVLATAAAAVVLILPGYVLSFVCGLRGLAAAAMAPAFAMTVIAVGSTLGPVVGVSWSLVLYLVTVLALAAVAGVLRRAFRGERERRPVWGTWRSSVLIALALAATLIGVQVLSMIGAADAFSQTFDNIFHLNAIRYILDTGSASSLTVGQLTSPAGAAQVYPAGWHAYVALVVQVTGASIPLAVNAATLVIASVVWPLGMIYLTTTLFGSRPVLTIAAGLAAAIFPQFPLLLMYYGVLYPFQLSIAVLPGVLAMTLNATARRASAVPGRSWAVMLVIASLPGLAVAHPGGFVAWVAFSLPMATFTFVVAFQRRVSMRARAWTAVGGLLYIAVALMVVLELRPPEDARGWPIEMNVLQATGQLLILEAGGVLPSILAAGLAAAGVVLTVRRRELRDLAFLASAAIGVGLFLVVASLPFGTLRDLLTGSWYNNIPRLAAMLPVVLAPFAALAGEAVWLRLAAMRIRRPIASAAAVSAVLLLLTQVSTADLATTGHREAFALTDTSPLVSADELKLLDELPELVPADDTIVGSPWTGTSLAYALSDRRVLLAHTLAYEDDESRAITDGLAEATPESPACVAADDLRVEYVLDFGEQEVHGGRHEYPGLTDLHDSAAVELVTAEGDAKLYKITGCR